MGQPAGGGDIPVSTFDTTVARHFSEGIIDVRVAGELSVSTAPELRTTVLNCVAEDPIAVVLDLNGMIATGPAALTLFPALQRQGGSEAPVPLLLHMDAVRPLREALDKFRSLAVFDSRPAALSALRGGVAAPYRVLQYLPGEPASAAAARAFVVEQCRRWGLVEAGNIARVVANELVTNAIRHARTDLTVTMTRGRRYLTICVRDRSSQAPRTPTGMPDGTGGAAGGRGLALVGMLAAGWGTFLNADGKAVWADVYVGRRRASPN